MMGRRVILVVAVLAGQVACGWMRQCCAAGCPTRTTGTQTRTVARQPAPVPAAKSCSKGCCPRGSDKTGDVRNVVREPVAPSAPDCCPFGRQCNDEAERSRDNPTSAGEGRSVIDGLPVGDAADVAFLTAAMVGAVPRVGRTRFFSAPAPPAMTSRLRI